MAGKDEVESRHPSTRDSTDFLLRRVRDGDRGARERLAARYVETLRRLARGRLPHAARDRYETEELVQEAVMRGLDKAAGFEPRGEGAFLAYLRKILLNLIRDEVRRAARRPQRSDIPETLQDPDPTPLTLVISSELREKYEAALEQLPAAQREAVLLRMEGHSFEEVARATHKPSADAARMVVRRGLNRMAKLMKDVRPES